MSVTTGKLSPNNAAAKHPYHTVLAPVIDATALLVRAWQIPKSFLVEAVQLFASAVTSTVTAAVGVVPPGKQVQAIVFAIATTTTRFKNTAAFLAVMPTKVAAQLAGVASLPAVVLAAITDNIAFSSAFTINVGAASGQFWGAARVQMDATGAFTTKVVAQDQVFGTEAPAIAAAPPADPGFFDCGTISIRSPANLAFTAQTTALNAAGVTVHYNGQAVGVQDVCTADPAFVAAALVKGAMQPAVVNRSCSQAGGLLVVQLTTSHTGAATDAEVTIDTRAWPLDGEVASS